MSHYKRQRHRTTPGEAIANVRQVQVGDHRLVCVGEPLDTVVETTEVFGRSEISQKLGQSHSPLLPIGVLRGSVLGPMFCIYYILSLDVFI